MKYILTYTAKRKNAKRHIFCRGNSVEELERQVKGFDQYIYEIYTSKWEFVKNANN